MFYDLTAEISPELVTFPGDPRYCTEIVSSLEEGQTFKLCHMHLGKDIPEGRYEIFIMPLNIPDMNGLPARVCAKTAHE